MTDLALARVMCSMSTSVPLDGRRTFKFTAHLTSWRSADRDMTSPLSKVASISCIASLAEPPGATGSESSVEMRATSEGVYEVLLVSVWSPDDLSWKHTSEGFSAGDDAARET